ncbi:restriction endonuclease subunit S [Pseudomonas sp. G5(2012)]|uniref:restriction endonuclease subunit S n=1 Tax=Pseudomonas sp. G5(2012) TaxID=1268068 RepID=UPI0005B36F6A|nr:restriction endonuclease subunit S [Pseudomonas sp. G5(2012)]
MSDELSRPIGQDIKVVSGFAFSSTGFSQLEGLPLIRIRDLASSSTEVRFKGRFDPAYLVTNGDILIGMDGDFEVHRWSGGAALLNQRVCKIEAASDSIDQRFLYWYLKPHVATIHRRTPQTTVRHLSTKDVVAIPMPSINSDEQRIVGKIIDTLDTAINETEAIIAKLRAVKQGLQHDLLTRGITANGEQRPAQAEAPHLYKVSPLGWIPKEWDVVTLESLSKTVTSGSRDWARFYADSGALFVRIGNLTREHINFRYESTIYVRPPRNADGQRTRLESGDILISITADLGIVGVVPDGLGEAYINQHIALVRPDLDVVNSRFIGHYLAGPIAQTYISKLNDAGAKAGLNLPTIRGLVTAKPLRAEQDLIATRLDEIDNRLQNATSESGKLRELKAGLMDDLLTGRVRVTPLLAEAAQQKGSA